MQKTSPAPKDAAALLSPHIPLLEALNPEQRQFLAGLSRVCVYSKGQTIYEEGRPVEGFHILRQGLVKICHFAADGREMVLHLIRPDGMFGVVPVFKGGVLPASAVAVAPSQTLFIPGPPFVDLIRRNPDLALDMLAAMAQRLYMFTRKLQAQNLREAPQRLAAYLLHRSRLAGGARSVVLETDRETLANMLGTARETLSRGLARLAETGAVEVRGREVVLHDVETLRHIAGADANFD